jgi:hypothetical protein
MRWTHPLTRRTMLLARADDRIWGWIILQGWLLGWGLGLAVEPYLPAVFTRPFGAAVLWPFSLLSHWGLAALLLAGGLVTATSCWLPMPDNVRLGLRMGATSLALLLFWSYLWSGFPYAAIQWGVFIAVIVASYRYMPTEC